MATKIPSTVHTPEGSINIKDEQYIIKQFIVNEPPVFAGSLRKYVITLKDDNPPYCPKCAKKKTFTTDVIRKTMTSFERWDVINRMPVKVHLDVRVWQCKKCRHLFADPRSPYHGNCKTTDAFESYVAETLLSSMHLTQDALAKRVNIPKANISRMLTNYIEKSKHKLPPAVPCETLWFMPFKYQKKWRLLILGRPDRQLGNFFGNPLWYRVAFLGISDEYSFEAALKSSNIAEPEKIQRIYCPGILRFEEAAERLIRKYNLKVFALSKHDPIMGWAIKMYAVLKDFQTRGFSLAQAAYMMRYKCHAYRTPIIDMSNKTSNNFFSPENDGKYATSFKYWGLLGKRCYYVDTETLLHYYGKQDFYGKQ